MQNFMIERLRVSGSGKEDGIVNFTDGLNLIQGRSNTGKTWILKCVYYLFSSDTRPYSPLTGYTDIEGTFLTRRFGRIVISRKLGEEIVTVSAKSKEVEDGEYATNYEKSSSRYLNDLWLRIIGLDETIEVPKSARYAREKMSWTNIASVFFADENEIDKSESIVIKDSRYETPVIASLFFLLTGDYKKGIPEIDKPEIVTARKKALLDYIEEQVTELTRKRSDYIRQLEELSNADIEKEIQELTDHIRQVQSEIQELMEENTSIVRQMSEYQKEYAEHHVLLDRYGSLISQYKADLERLDFISKGEKAVRELPPNGICPFCGGEIHMDPDDSY
ncbi:MAG: AAA family ATPase, partial [Lachnospiraceae bacterium]|nr:AAA family ATPase [Lachnospiraceae bacterium]